MEVGTEKPEEDGEPGRPPGGGNTLSRRWQHRVAQSRSCDLRPVIRWALWPRQVAVGRAVSGCPSPVAPRAGPQGAPARGSSRTAPHPSPRPHPAPPSRARARRRGGRERAQEAPSRGRPHPLPHHGPQPALVLPYFSVLRICSRIPRSSQPISRPLGSARSLRWIVNPRALGRGLAAGRGACPGRGVEGRPNQGPVTCWRRGVCVSGGCGRDGVGEAPRRTVLGVWPRGCAGVALRVLGGWGVRERSPVLPVSIYPISQRCFSALVCRGPSALACEAV